MLIPSDYKISSLSLEVKKILKKNSIANYQQETDWILEKITKQNKAKLYENFDKNLTQKQFIQLEKIVSQRNARKPLAYIFREAPFWKNIFFIKPPTFIPRKESELLVEEILNLPKKNFLYPLLEIGSGSGALSLSLAMEKSLEIEALDYSASAIAIAKKNQKKYIYCLNNQSSKVHFFCCKVEDYLSQNKKKFSIIFSNPPYISIKEKKEVSLEALHFEDKTALFAPKNGLYFYEIFSKKAKNNLIKGGFLVLEHGWRQKEEIIKIFHNQNWKFILAKKDLGKNDRILIFQA